MPRPRTIAIGAFILLLAATPFIPRGDDGDGGLIPSGDNTSTAGTAATAGFGAVTPDLAAEINRVVTQGRVLGRVSPRVTPLGLVSALVRCADFEGQRYCLNSGWTQDSQAQVQARMTTAARTISARRSSTESTGDLDVLATLQRSASLTPAQRAATERAELSMAARSVAKVWLLRHQIEGIALPTDFLNKHPEARSDVPVSANRASNVAKNRANYPEHAAILKSKRVADQTRTYWCGPAAMQMITWAWTGKKRGQTHWAGKLGTTSSGTAITDMVRVVNQATGWDSTAHAGPYISLDIGSYSYNQWLTLTMRHIVDYRAPIVLHPILLQKYYPYLDDDASGHFQVGRGYNKKGEKPTLISYFEPWNQQRFDPSEPYISRVQWRNGYKSYRANKDHFQQNIGV